MAPSPKTIKRLFSLSKNECAYPRCSNVLVNQTGNIIGEMCHINARNPGGPRYDSGLPARAPGASFSIVMYLTVKEYVLSFNNR